jgi:hypothetical protein
MPFANRGLPATSAPTPPAAPAAGAPPPPPAPAPTSTLKLWVSLNGQSVLKNEAEARLLPPTTPAMSENQQSGWLTIAALLPVAAAASGAPGGAPGGRAAFGGRAAPAPQTPAPIGGTPATLFSGVEGAHVYRRGSNMEPGDYIAKLDTAEFKAARTGKNHIILGVKIIVSSYDANNPDKAQANQEGSTCAIFINQNDNFTSNMKEVMLAVSGFDAQGKPRPEDDVVTQDECAALISEQQPYTGALVYLEARSITTRAGNPFTRISWWPCPQLADGSPDLTKLMAEVR